MKIKEPQLEWPPCALPFGLRRPGVCGSGQPVGTPAHALLVPLQQPRCHMGCGAT